MNIIFLCASTEPGRDGVGDYSRRLAGELINQGNKASLIALNDRNLQADSMIEVQSEFGKEINVLRLSAKLSWTKRTKTASDFINSKNPDWLSLQYVPYGFQDKGLPVVFLQNLKRLIGNRKLHIMFHETWIGFGPKWSNKVTSFLQKMLTRTMILSLKPTLSHTHLPSYQKTLENLGFNVKALPLFSNISAESVTDVKSIPTTLRIGFFSQTGKSEVVISFLKNLAEQTASKGLRLEILLIGGQNKSMQEFGGKLEAFEEFKGKVSYTGFLNPGELSVALQSCELGVTPVPRHALGKSGSVAAFLTHGIPVAAPKYLPQFPSEEIGFFSSTLQSAIMIKPDLDKLSDLKKTALRAIPEIEVSAIAKTLLFDIQNNNI